MYAITQQVVMEAPQVITSIVLILGQEVYALIDLGSTHLYISYKLAHHL